MFCCWLELEALDAFVRRISDPSFGQDGLRIRLTRNRKLLLYACLANYYCDTETGTSRRRPQQNQRFRIGLQEIQLLTTIFRSRSEDATKAQEWWLSGRKRRFAKSVTRATGSAGSNPVHSARFSDLSLSRLIPSGRANQSSSIVSTQTHTQCL